MSLHRQPRERRPRRPFGPVPGVALEGLPIDALEPVGGREGARSLLDVWLRADIDGDGDGERESVSFALALSAVRADATTWSPTR